MKEYAAFLITTFLSFSSSFAKKRHKQALWFCIWLNIIKPFFVFRLIFTFIFIFIVYICCNVNAIILYFSSILTPSRISFAVIRLISFLNLYSKLFRIFIFIFFADFECLILTIMQIDVFHLEFSNSCAFEIIDSFRILALPFFSAISSIMAADVFLGFSSS
jgi:hypothetical protein